MCTLPYIFNRHVYKYDANGNMVLDSIGRVMKDGHFEENISKRQLLWDDENRLLAINDNGYVSSYLYNANGDRTVKLSGNNEAVYVNTIPSANETQTDRFTIYPSPYIVFTNGGRYTKHIYIGSERIVSKVAIDNGYDPTTAPTAAYGNNSYVTKLNNQSAALNDSVEAIYTKFQLPFNGLNNDDIIQGFQPALRSMVSTTSSSTDNYEEYSYYIHSDHLGSSSYITDTGGEVSQHVEYVPFGEVFIEELSSSAKLNTPFLFNGKELDEETGLYYYGARYYDPRTSLWLSTDPMELKYPNVSTYCYTRNNPINAIDPNGGVVIFINGMHFGDGGTSKYWNGLDNRIMNKIGDRKALYYDGAIGGYTRVFSGNTNFIAENRFNAGKEMGILNAKSIFTNLSGEESIKFVSHSMGAAYTKGFIAGLKEYAIKNNIEISNLIEMEIDLAPFQPDCQKAYEDINTIVIQHAFDGVAGIGKMQNARQRYVTREDTYITDKNALNVFLEEHSVDSFTQDEINKYVPSSNRNAE